MRISDWSSDVCSSDLLTDGAAASVSLQPLARIHETPERAWAADWMVAILVRESVTITPDVKELLWSALTSLASAPVAERTLTGLSVLLQSSALKQALRPYCVGGPYGRLLDRAEEHPYALQSLMRLSYA